MLWVFNSEDLADSNENPQHVFIEKYGKLSLYYHQIPPYLYHWVS